MLAAKNVHLLTGATWEYAVFIVGYFTIVHRAKVLDNTEIEMLGEIRKAIRVNISPRIPEIVRTLAAVI
jgi:hypothetical protein